MVNSYTKNQNLVYILKGNLLIFYKNFILIQVDFLIRPYFKVNAAQKKIFYYYPFQKLVFKFR